MAGFDYLFLIRCLDAKSDESGRCSNGFLSQKLAQVALPVVVVGVTGNLHDHIFEDRFLQHAEAKWPQLPTLETYFRNRQEGAWFGWVTERQAKIFRPTSPDADSTELLLGERGERRQRTYQSKHQQRDGLGFPHR